MFRRKKLVLVATPLLCVLLSGGLAVAATKEMPDRSADEAASLSNNAVASATGHRYAEAIDLLKRAIALQPELYVAHYNLG
jgi:hypothetical protein